MGKHIYTLSLRIEVDSPEVKNGESGANLTVSPSALYQTVAGLRSEILADCDELSAGEFTEAVTRAAEVNAILAQIEAFEGFDDDEDDDDE